MMRRGNRDDVVVTESVTDSGLRSLMMRIVDQRLQQWAVEYRDHPTRAWTILARLIDHAGFVPDVRGHVPTPINTQADEIEQIVQRMSTNGMHKAAMVLRCEYFDKHSPDEARLEHLRAVGCKTSRSGYYELLNIAKFYVAGAINVSEKIGRVGDAVRSFKSS
ncbi:MAG TPA: hypothetical protein VFN69_04590 [Rudaea sp.]|nr:hypothetical protein [Rudaea sp.]